MNKERDKTIFKEIFHEEIKRKQRVKRLKRELHRMYQNQRIQSDDYHKLMAYINTL